MYDKVDARLQINDYSRKIERAIKKSKLTTSYYSFNFKGIFN